MYSSIIAEVRREKRSILTEIESKQLMAEAGIPVVETKLAGTEAEAIARSQEIGFPVALKIVSPDVVHKSDSGGVRLGLESATEVSTAYSEIMAAAEKASPGAAIHGVSVQKMARSGVEVVIGMSKDLQFGPVLMFGLGGIFVEVLKDVSFRIVPLTERDAKQMIREIKGFPVLEGYRGQEPANLPLLENILLKLSDFVDGNPEIRELDLNPIFAYRDAAVAVDARVILESSNTSPDQHSRSGD
jgi:acyl-CoA synthetase (NDP forming)